MCNDFIKCHIDATLTFLYIYIYYYIFQTFSQLPSNQIHCLVRWLPTVFLLKPFPLHYIFIYCRTFLYNYFVVFLPLLLSQIPPTISFDCNVVVFNSPHVLLQNRCCWFFFTYLFCSLIIYFFFETHVTRLHFMMMLSACNIL